MTRDRLAFLLLWCLRSGMTEGNVKLQWQELRGDERDLLYAWADRELGSTQ